MSEEKCPYCNRVIDWEDLPSYGDDDSFVHECGCGKKFDIAPYLFYVITQDCKLNGEEHDWESRPGYERCKNCDEVK